MKQRSGVARYPIERPLVADSFIEFHAARLLLLVHICGTKGRIDGLTKMAKLDFFVRYPEFFNRAATSMGRAGAPSPGGVESAMIRYRYGPWDKRYYQTLVYLTARSLLAVEAKGNSYSLELTNDGVRVAEQLAGRKSFAVLARQMRSVRSVFGGKTGSALKKLIYELFDEEVGQVGMNKVI